MSPFSPSLTVSLGFCPCCPPPPQPYVWQGMPFPKSLRDWFLSVVQLGVETSSSFKVSILNPLPCRSLQSYLICFTSLSTRGRNPWTSTRIGNELAEKPRVHSPQVRREQETVCLGLSMQVPPVCPFLRGEPPTDRGVCVRGGVQVQLILPHPGWSRAQGVW